MVESRIGGRSENQGQLWLLRYADRFGGRGMRRHGRDARRALRLDDRRKEHSRLHPGGPGECRPERYPGERHPQGPCRHSAGRTSESRTLRHGNHRNGRHFSEQCAVLAHVGDSRIYQLRGRRKVFRTFDHSMVFEMVKERYPDRRAGTPLRQIEHHPPGTGRLRRDRTGD